MTNIRYEKPHDLPPILKLGWVHLENMETPQCASFSFPSLFQYWPTSENKTRVAFVHFTFQLRRHFDYRKVCIATSVMISRSPNESEMDNHIQQLFAWQKARVKRLCHKDWWFKEKTNRKAVSTNYVSFCPRKSIVDKSYLRRQLSFLLTRIKPGESHKKHQ